MHLCCGHGCNRSVPGSPSSSVTAADGIHCHLQDLCSGLLEPSNRWPWLVTSRNPPVNVPEGAVERLLGCPCAVVCLGRQRAGDGREQGGCGDPCAQTWAAGIPNARALTMLPRVRASLPGCSGSCDSQPRTQTAHGGTTKAHVLTVQHSQQSLRVAALGRGSGEVRGSPHDALEHRVPPSVWVLLSFTISSGLTRFPQTVPWPHENLRLLSDVLFLPELSDIKTSPYVGNISKFC